MLSIWCSSLSIYYLSFMIWICFFAFLASFSCFFWSNDWEIILSSIYLILFNWSSSGISICNYLSFLSDFYWSNWIPSEAKCGWSSWTAVSEHVIPSSWVPFYSRVIIGIGSSICIGICSSSKLYWIEASLHSII